MTLSFLQYFKVILKSNSHQEYRWQKLSRWLFEGFLGGDLIQIAAPAFRKAAKQEIEMKNLIASPMI